MNALLSVSVTKRKEKEKVGVLAFSKQINGYNYTSRARGKLQSCQFAFFFFSLFGKLQLWPIIVGFVIIKINSIHVYFKLPMPYSKEKKEKKKSLHN